MKKFLKKFKFKKILMLPLLALLGISALFLGSWSYDDSTELVSSFNIWDEQYEVGGINSSGEFVEYNSIRSNYISVNSSTSYFISFPKYTIFIFYYTSNKTFIGYSEKSYSTNFTTPSNCSFIAFQLSAYYGTTYNNDISIIDVDNLQQSPVLSYYINSSCYNYNDVVGRIYHINVGIVDLSTLDWIYVTGDTNPKFQVNFNRALGASGWGYELPNAFCPNYITTSWSNIAGDTNLDNALTIAPSHDIAILDRDFTDVNSLKNFLKGKYLYYQLNTSLSIPYDNWQYNTIYEPFGSYVDNNLYLETKDNYELALIAIDQLQQDYRELQQEYNYLDGLYHNALDTIEYKNNAIEVLNQQILNLQTAIITKDLQISNLQNRINSLEEVLFPIDSVTLSTCNYSFSQNEPYDINIISNKSDYIDELGLLNCQLLYNNIIGSSGNSDTSILLQWDEPQSFVNKNLIFNIESWSGNLFIDIRYSYNGIDSFVRGSLNDSWDSVGQVNILNLLSKKVGLDPLILSTATYSQICIVYQNLGSSLNSILLNGDSSFNQGYAKGWEDLEKQQTPYISELNTDLQRVTAERDTLLRQYNTTLAQLQELSNSDLQLNLTSLIWNIGATPFESFKSIWNVEFLRI